MRFYRGDEQMGKRIDTSWQNNVPCEVRVKETLVSISAKETVKKPY